MNTFEKVVVTAPWVAWCYMRGLREIADAETPCAITDEQSSVGDPFYPARKPAIRWRPSLQNEVAQALGVDQRGPLAEGDLIQLFSAKRVDNGQAWSRMHRKISAIDFITQPHKSVTLAAVFAPTATEAAAIWSCIDDANDSAMSRLAAVLGWARKGHGGRNGTVLGSTAWISFRHYVARPTLVLRYGEANTRIAVETPGRGDPHAHIHNVLFNLIVTEDGRIGSLDTQRLTRAVLHLCGAHFQAELARLLRARGIRVGCHPNGAAAVLPAVDGRAVELFSSRSAILGQVAREYVERVGLEWNKLGAAAKHRFERAASKLTRLRSLVGVPDWECWQEQAALISWRHSSVLEGIPASQVASVDCVEKACITAAHQVTRDLADGSVLDEDWLKVYAARALIAVGMTEASDIDKVASLLVERFSQTHGGLKPVASSFRERRQRRGPTSLLSYKTAAD